MKKRFLSLVAITMVIAITTKAQIISTVAGNGTSGFSGDGGIATNAQLGFGYGGDISVDTVGNIYFLDYGNGRIRKVSTNGIITTIAGGSGSNLNPISFALDLSGNIYIADGNNNVIKKLSKNGNISVIAGNGISGYSGDGGIATNAQLSYPTGVAIDSIGNIYISDATNNVIRKVSINDTITTIAGNGKSGYGGDGGLAINAEFNCLVGLAIDFIGNLYIADGCNARYRKVDKNGIITTIAGTGVGGYSGDGGLAINAMVLDPYTIKLDKKGNIYIPDTGNDRVRKIDKNGIITTIAGNGTQGFCCDGSLATNAELYFPWGVAIDANDNIYIDDVGNNRIRKVTNSSLPVTLSSFTAKTYTKTIQTNWQTATEQNISLFNIQHSDNAESFIEIGTIKALGSGANNYEFTDNKPTNGINYYRLQSVDKDGNNSYSKVVSINFGNNKSLSIAPNPARDFATISFSKTVDKATIAVYDITGKAVITQSLNGTNTYKLNTQTLTNGVYVIKVNTATGSYNEKLLINK